MASSYDEVYDRSGALRPAFASLQRRLGLDLLRPTAAQAACLRDHPLGDDIRILPVPWALDDSAYASVIQAGITQRARALQMFFADMVLGRQRFLESHTSLTPQLLAQILGTEMMSLARLREVWKGHSLDEICFTYGPDLVRGPDGSWLVIEDNVGCVGGLADNAFVWNAYLGAVGRADASTTAADLHVALARWAELTDRDIVVGLSGCDSYGDDLGTMQLSEHTRRRTILASSGIQLVDADDLEGLLASRPRVAIANFSVDSSPAEFDLIVTAFGQHVPLLNSPGTGILGNKALLPFGGDMIRFYCEEEPLIATSETYILRDGLLPAEPGEWVVKSASGCQGTEVFVLRWQSADRMEAIHTLVSGSWPRPGFVAQAYVEPSHLATSGPAAWESYLLELRPVTYVLGWSDVYVSRQPLGKAVSSFGIRPLHNISRGACYVPTTREAPG